MSDHAEPGGAVRDPLPETERLIVRRFAEDDFDALLAIQSRPDVARWLYWDARGAGEVRRSLENKLRGATLAEDGDCISLAVVRKDSGELIGDCTICLRSREHRQGEIGFIFHPDHHGRGFATEAARVLERIGMRREGHLVENEFVKGEWQSELLYAILEREWRAAP